MVKVTEIDDRGRVNLSRKQAILELAGGSGPTGNGAPTGERPPGS